MWLYNTVNNLTSIKYLRVLPTNMAGQVEPDWQIICSDCTEDGVWASAKGWDPDYCPHCGAEAHTYELD